MMLWRPSKWFVNETLKFYQGLYDNVNGFIEQAQANGEPITKELLLHVEDLKHKAHAFRSYRDRPLRCKLGFHKRRPNGLVGALGTCQICYREDVENV